MKLNTDNNSPDYWALHYPNGVEVFLDGNKIQYVVSLDTEAGWLDYLVQDAEGKILLNPENPEEAWVKHVNGKVEIKAL